MNTSLKLVRFEDKDINGLIALSASVGWDYEQKEIQTILESGSIFGHINEFGEVVSSAAIIPYDTSLASIGMVIVHPGYRGLGLGKVVTQACINHLDNNRAFMLIATPEGRPLYEKMGFKSVNTVHKFLTKDENQFAITTYFEIVNIEPYKEEYLHSIIELDKESFGARRSIFLQNRINQSERTLVIKDNKGTIIGFGLSIMTPANLILGPIVAPNVEGACALITSLVDGYKGKLRIDVPPGNELFMEFLLARGFEKVSQPPVMILHMNEMPARNGHLYGIAAQAFG